MEDNPYKAPASEPERTDPQPPERQEPEPHAGALRLARCLFVGAVVALLLNGARAIQMRNIAWGPVSGEAYNGALAMHASMSVAAGVAVLGAVGHLLVPEAMAARRLPSLPVAWAGASAWAAGAVLLQVAFQLAGGQFVLAPGARVTMLAALVLLAAGAALTALHLGAVFVAGVRRARMVGRVAAFGCIAALAGQSLALANAAVSVLEQMTTYEVAWSSDDQLGYAVLGAVAIGLYFVIGPRRATPASRWTPLVLMCAGAFPAAAMRWLSGTALTMVSVDLQLHDTYFEVGHLHAAGTVLTVTLFAGLFSWAPSLTTIRPRAGWSVAAGMVACLGLHATTITALQLGRRGMPRRYLSYLPQFQPLHQEMAIAAVVAAAGVVALVAALLIGKRPPRIRPDAATLARMKP